MENVIFSNPLEFERKKAALKAGGAQHLHVVADYDKTLTTAFENGEKRQSLVELIRKHNYLSPEYPALAYGLFDKYHPFEIDPELLPDQRKEKMVEWWTVHVKIMGEQGMSRDIVERIVREQPLNPRIGLSTFLDTLHSAHIPLLILSASVTDLIEGFLKKEKLLYDNIHVISNKYNYDSAGKVIGYEGTIVHSLNKGEIILKDTPYFKQMQNRKNVILLGDGLDDVDMVAGMHYDCVLKIGFLNDNPDKNLDRFKKVYDVVILHDGSMDFVNDLLAEILS